MHSLQRPELFPVTLHQRTRVLGRAKYLSSKGLKTVQLRKMLLGRGGQRCSCWTLGQRDTDTRTISPAPPHPPHPSALGRVSHVCLFLTVLGIRGESLPPLGPVRSPRGFIWDHPALAGDSLCTRNSTKAQGAKLRKRLPASLQPPSFTARQACRDRTHNIPMRLSTSRLPKTSTSRDSQTCRKPLEEKGDLRDPLRTPHQLEG